MSSSVTYATFRDKRLLFTWIAIFASCLIVLSTTEAFAARAIPDEMLYLPFLVVKNLNIGNSIKGDDVGSGFFLKTSSSAYFVTAKHVLFKEGTGELLYDNIGLIGHGGSTKGIPPFVFDINLSALNKKKRIRSHDKYDVAVFRIGAVKSNGQIEKSAGGKSLIKFDSDIFLLGGLNLEKAQHIAVGLDSVKKYEGVLISNDVLVFGYPTSIGLGNLPQIDYSQPLLRKGIVAGKNDKRKVIIIDCPVYPGNSGGPVIEIEYDEKGRQFRLIGLIIELVPVSMVWTDTQGNENLNISNSGYSIVVPMDAVLELVNDMEKALQEAPH